MNTLTGELRSQYAAILRISREELDILLPDKMKEKDNNVGGYKNHEDSDLEMEVMRWMCEVVGRMNGVLTGTPETISEGLKRKDIHVNPSTVKSIVGKLIGAKKISMVRDGIKSGKPSTFKVVENGWKMVNKLQEELEVTKVEEDVTSLETEDNDVLVEVTSNLEILVEAPPVVAINAESERKISIEMLTLFVEEAPMQEVKAIETIEDFLATGDKNFRLYMRRMMDDADRVRGDHEILDLALTENQQRTTDNAILAAQLESLKAENDDLREKAEGAEKIFKVTLDQQKAFFQVLDVCIRISSMNESEYSMFQHVTKTVGVPQSDVQQITQPLIELYEKLVKE